MWAHDFLNIYLNTLETSRSDVISTAINSPCAQAVASITILHGKKPRLLGEMVDSSLRGKRNR